MCSTFVDGCCWHKELGRPEVTQAFFSFVGGVRSELYFWDKLVEKRVANLMSQTKAQASTTNMPSQQYVEAMNIPASNGLKSCIRAKLLHNSCAHNLSTSKVEAHSLVEAAGTPKPPA
jgi:hypothetical protein